MAAEKPTFFNNKKPLEEHEEEEEEEDPELEVDYEESYTSSGSCCFNFCCFRRLRKSGHNSRRSLLQGENREPWYMKKIKKLKEVSELFAGPKWKTFLRKFNNDGRKRKPQFQYDPLSYALNFDGGDDREDGEVIGFSTRFAVPIGGSELARDSAGFALDRS